MNGGTNLVVFCASGCPIAATPMHMFDYHNLINDRASETMGGEDL